MLPYTGPLLLPHPSWLVRRTTSAKQPGLPERCKFTLTWINCVRAIPRQVEVVFSVRPEGIRVI